MAETTEEALRKALEELRAWTGDFWPVGKNNPKSRGAKCETVFEMRELVRAALALPLSPSRVEYRVAAEYKNMHRGIWQKHGPSACDDLAKAVEFSRHLSSSPKTFRSVQIEYSRVPDRGPWLHYQGDEKV